MPGPLPDDLLRAALACCYTVISSRVTLVPKRFSISGCAAKYSPIAILMLSNASSRVVPWLLQPGRSSHQTAKPSSDSTTVTWYVITQKMQQSERLLKTFLKFNREAKLARLV